jgi:hypothetical protein
VEVVAQRVVQHPRLARDARLQHVDELEESIHPRVVEGRDVLVVVVERADAGFGQHADQRVREHQEPVVDEQVDRQVDGEQR